jgi:hypothetical protein
MLKGTKDQALFVYKLSFYATKKGKVKRKTAKPKQNFRTTYCTLPSSMAA